MNMTNFTKKYPRVGGFVKTRKNSSWTKFFSLNRSFIFRIKKQHVPINNQENWHLQISLSTPFQIDHLQSQLMMKPLLPLLLLLGILSISTLSFAQAPYKTAAGLRLGYPNAISIKQFVNESLAAEVYAGTRGYYYGRWINISGALQIHKPLDIIDGLEGLNYYFGAGASVYFWTYNSRYYSSSYATTSFGAQGYLGLEYSLAELIPEFPVSVTIDWVPTIYLGSRGYYGLRSFGGEYANVGIRYILK